MAKTKQPSSKFSKLKRLFWVVFLAGLGAAFMLFLLASYGAFGPMPDHTALENPRTNLATEIMSADGIT